MKKRTLLRANFLIVMAILIFTVGNGRALSQLTVYFPIIMNGVEESPPINLAPNPSFEIGTNFPVSWTTFSSGASYDWSDATAHLGSRSICITDVSAYNEGYWITTNVIPISPGKTIRMSVWAIGIEDLENGMEVRYFNSSGNPAGTYSMDVDYNSSGWTNTEFNTTVPSSVTSLDLKLFAYNWDGNQSTSAWVCFDDVYFVIE